MKNATLRTYEPNYITEVDKWWGVLLPMLVPYLFCNGGPIIMAQLENEFGSYGNVATNPLDLYYMQHLRDVARDFLGNDIILMTTDGGTTAYMHAGCANMSDVYAVGDFGPSSNPLISFAAQKLFNPPGMSPPMCTEYYSGWLTHWLDPSMQNTSTQLLAIGVLQLLKLNASFSFYMGHGGTNFGFWSGANGDGGSSFVAHITSYDYDAMVSEGNPKYTPRPPT